LRCCTGVTGAVDQDKADLGGFDPGLQFLDLARPEQHARLRARQAHDIGGHDLEIGQGRGQRHRLLQRGAGRLARSRSVWMSGCRTMVRIGARSVVLSDGAACRPAVTLRRRRD
jgi:hypothetical protein